MVKYSSEGKEEMRPSAKLGAVLIVIGIILFPVSGLRIIGWCLFTGFLLITAGTFICGVGAILLWRIPRVFWIIVSLCGGLLLATYFFIGFC